MAKILVLDRSEELAEQIRGFAHELPAEPEIVSCTKIGSIDHVQEHDGPFEVLVAGPSLGTRAGLRRLAALHREAPGMEVVVAFAENPDATLREIIQVGAVDMVDYPTDDIALRAALRRALEMAERLGTITVYEPVYQPAEAAVPQRSARIFTVCSATGGCGKTFYATNMAMFLSENSGARIALVDLDLQFGEITTSLRLRPSYTIADVLSQSSSEDAPVDLTSHIEDYLVTYDEKFWTLPAPKEPAQADRITPAEVTKVLDALRTHYDYIVVDTPTALAETVLAAFDLSEHLFVMATLDLPSVRNLGLFLQTLQKLRISSDNVSLVLNKVEKDVGIDVDQIRKLFPQGFRSTLPYAKEVSRSVNMGKPILGAQPDSDISRRISDGLWEFLPPEARARDRAPVPAKIRMGSLSRLFKRRVVQVTEGAR
ncbi:MAG: AAA family ATPase [Actinomycetota bacterium]